MAELSAAAAQLLGRLDGLAVDFAPYVAQSDSQARLPPQISDRLLREGFFRLWIPASVGGLELSLVDALRIYEAAASSTAVPPWVTTQAAVNTEA